MGQVLSNVETQANAFFVDGFVLLHDLAKQFEQIFLVFLADSNSSVINLKLDCGSCHQNFLALSEPELAGPEHKLDVSFERELGRVTQDVDQDLLQTLVVRLNHVRDVWRDAADQIHILL